MKAILVISFLISFNLYSASKVILLSDLDDTFKITNTVNPAGMIWNGFISKKAFAGMSDLYQNLSSRNTRYFVSKSPNILRPAINKLFKKYNLELADDHLTLRTNFSEDGFDYKYNAIMDALEDHPNKKIILVGDDSGEDHEIYEQVRADFPSRVSGIYIRSVKGKTMPVGIISYLTAFDIALNEFEMGHLEQEQVVKIGKTILNTKKNYLVFPRYLKCPINRMTSQDLKLDEISIKIFERIQSICNRRKAKAS